MYLGAWFSDMGWGEVVVALVPVLVVMWLIRRCEERSGTPAYTSLSPAAKGWLWLMSVRSGVSARLMSQVEPGKLRAYMAAGTELELKADRLFAKVAREYADSNPDAHLGGEDILLSLSEFAAEHPLEAVQAMLKLWPVAAVVEKPSEQQTQAAVEAQKLTAAQAGQMAPLQPCVAPNLEPCAELKPIAVLEEDSAPTEP